MDLPRTASGPCAKSSSEKPNAYRAVPATKMARADLLMYLGLNLVLNRKTTYAASRRKSRIWKHGDHVAKIINICPCRKLRDGVISGTAPRVTSRYPFDRQPHAF